MSRQVKYRYENYDPYIDVVWRRAAFLPVSLRLMEAGHSVKLAAPFRFRNLVKEHRINFLPSSGDPEELSRRRNRAGHNFVKLLSELMNHAIEIGADVWHQMKEACKDADLIIHTFTHAVGARTLAREKGIPDIHIQTFPMFTPTGDYPNIMIPHGMPCSLNHLTHQFSAKMISWTSHIGFEHVRRRAGLRKRKPFGPLTTIQFTSNPYFLYVESENSPSLK